MGKNDLVMVQVEKQKISLDSNQKVVDNTNMDEITKAENEVAQQIQKSTSFNGLIIGYTVVEFEPKRYDLYKITIDPETHQAKAERMGKKWDNRNRAFVEMQTMYAHDLIAKNKEEQKRFEAARKAAQKEVKDNE